MVARKQWTATATATTLAAALAYAARGWRVLPIRAGSKVPLTAHGVHDATTDPDAIRAWWVKWPSANVAIACGAKSGGLVVLDVDQAEMLWQLEKTCGAMPRTRKIRTGRGTHHYFLSPEPIRTQRLAKGLEAHGEDTYVLAPPSTHLNGRRYEVAEDVDLAPLPDALRELLTAPRAPEPPREDLAPVTRIAEGERNSTLTSLAGAMRRKSATKAEILAALLTANRERCDPPLAESEVERIAASVARYASASAKLKHREGSHQAILAAVETTTAAVSALTPEQARTRLAEVLFQIGGFLSSYVAISTAQTHVLAVWVFHTHVIDAAERTPYLHVRSPEKRCGKSLLLDLLKLLVRNPWRTSNASAAAIPRKISSSRPTALFDEADTYVRAEDERGETLRGVLDAGFERGGAYSRCVGQGAALRVEDFDAFCAKAIAGLRDLPATVADRSISIRMKRALPGEIQKRFHRREVEPAAAKLRERIEACAAALIPALQETRPERVEELNDRANDIVEPLLALADLAGDGWPEYLRGFLCELFQDEEESETSLGICLLSDLRGIFEERAIDRLASADLVQALRERPESPWADWRGKGITGHSLARMLRSFGIKPGRWRDGSKIIRGYEGSSFADVWTRYLPVALSSQEGGQTSQTSQAAESTS